MTEADILAYVNASARLHGLTLDEERLQAVTVHMVRTHRLACVLNELVLLPEIELAEIYLPAPFPSTDEGRAAP